MGTIRRIEIEPTKMRTLRSIISESILVCGGVVSNGAVVTRISDETGVPVDTLQAQRASTGLGWGELENAHLLANASGKNFNDIVAMHNGGEGWGKIAHDNGLNLGRIVSDAHRSSQSASHAQNTATVHGKSSSIHGRSATSSGKGHMSTMKGVSHGSSVRSGRG